MGSAYSFAKPQANTNSNTNSYSNSNTSINTNSYCKLVKLIAIV